MILSILFKIPYQKNLIQKILGFSWIVVGYKFFLEQYISSTSNDLENNFFTDLMDMNKALLIFTGLMCLITGFIFLINFNELKNKIKKLTLKTFFSGIVSISSIIFLNNNHNYFDFNKKIFTLTEEPAKEIPTFGNRNNIFGNNFNKFHNSVFDSDYNDDYDYFDSFFTSENILKLFVIIFNFVPLILNSIWGDMISFKSKTNFLLKNVIPNPVFISLLTILLKYFMINNIKSTGYLTAYNIINFTCYLIFISFIIYEFFISYNFSFWTFFYLILILINFVLIFFFNKTNSTVETFDFKTESFKETGKN